MAAGKTLSLSNGSRENNCLSLVLLYFAMGLVNPAELALNLSLNLFNVFETFSLPL